MWSRLVVEEDLDWVAVASPKDSSLEPVLSCELCAGMEAVAIQQARTKEPALKSLPAS